MSIPAKIRYFPDPFPISWNLLIQHRFGSHVCQTLFSLAADTIDREVSSLKICFMPVSPETDRYTAPGKRDIS